MSQHRALETQGIYRLLTPGLNQSQSVLHNWGLFQKAGFVKTLSLLTLTPTKPVQRNSESVTRATYSMKLTCSLAGLLQLNLSFPYS